MSNADVVKIIANCLQIPETAISDVLKLKTGLTNTSYVFTVDKYKYVIRLPGTGTAKLINRRNEITTYSSISDLHISDEIVYMNQDGIKITKFIANSHRCDDNMQDLIKCINTLKTLHNAKIKTSYTFDFIERINYYESLFNHKSKYVDYINVKDDIIQLIHIVDKLKKRTCLCHIDANYDNFLITDNKTYLLDWEYAAMQDPDLDIAMYAIYANYSISQLNTLIQIYYNEKPTDIIIKKIYAYVAIGAFIWSNWCEYKYQCGENLGNYMQQQFDIAKQYSTIALQMFGYERVETAVLFAAGKGTRLQPLTNNCPKPLVKINGIPLIEYSINALFARGIQKIVIITGYLSEQFEYLRNKYSNIQLLQNSNYNITNNITSMYTYFANTNMVNVNTSVLFMDADQVIVNERCIKRYIRANRYTTSYSKSKRNEWAFKINNHKIIDCEANLLQKENFYAVIPVSYYTSISLKILADIVKYEVIIKHNTNIYYDDVALCLYKHNFIFIPVIIRQKEIIEIDNIDDYNYCKEILTIKQ